MQMKVNGRSKWKCVQQLESLSCRLHCRQPCSCEASLSSAAVSPHRPCVFVFSFPSLLGFVTIFSINLSPFLSVLYNDSASKPNWFLSSHYLSLSLSLSLSSNSPFCLVSCADVALCDWTVSVCCSDGGQQKACQKYKRKEKREGEKERNQLGFDAESL